MVEEIKSTEAKQGARGSRTLTILLVGLALALIVFAGLGLYGRVLPDQNIGGAEQSDVAPATPPAGQSQTGTVTPGQDNAPGQ